MSAQPAPASPCINRCELGPHGRCLGCGRTGDQIAHWSAASAEQKQAILDDIRPLTVACDQCGRRFACASISGHTCWCMRLPPLLPATPGKNCLCPVCLDHLMSISPVTG